MTALQNFESIAAELVRVSPSQKAADFAVRIADQIRAKGEAWISANESALHIYSSAADQYFDVASNRLFFIEKWQVALRG